VTPLIQTLFFSRKLQLTYYSANARHRLLIANQAVTASFCHNFSADEVKTATQVA
jgi:hypothetical protein